jgi:hypothetical protein
MTDNPIIPFRLPMFHWLADDDIRIYIFESDRPEARRFVRWLCHDVVPEIWSTGSYHGAMPDFRTLEQHLAETFGKPREEKKP